MPDRLCRSLFIPGGERQQLKRLSNEVIQANINFLEEVVVAAKSFTAPPTGPAPLARKNAHLALARLSEALQTMHMEPSADGTDVERGKAIQELSDKISAVITSLYLSKEKIEGSVADLADKILKELRYSLTLSSSGIPSQDQPDRDNALAAMDLERSGLSQLVC
jgi:uncharacterized membrane protein YccC